MRHLKVFATAALALGLLALGSAAAFTADDEPDVIFVPTPQEVVEKMLEIANVKKDADPAREVLRIMRELGTAWQQIALQQRQAHATGAASSMVRPRLSAIAV